LAPFSRAFGLCTLSRAALYVSRDGRDPSKPRSVYPCTPPRHGIRHTAARGRAMLPSAASRRPLDAAIFPSRSLRAPLRAAIARSAEIVDRSVDRAAGESISGVDANASRTSAGIWARHVGARGCCASLADIYGKYTGITAPPRLDSSAKY